MPWVLPVVHQFFHDGKESLNLYIGESRRRLVKDQKIRTVI